ncbi:MAG: MBOAT family protein [Spirochaetes bacterium]|nr:MBOAT family protein [Spirochaetota bacterium]
MLFNSYTFFIFLSAVLIVFYNLPHRFRWIFMLAASYLYYMWWDPRYAILVFSTTVVVYVTALLMHGRPQRVKKLYVAASVSINIGILALIKYFNFINNSLKDLFDFFGAAYPVPAFNFLLPIGISFYTFQALSYTIDIYRGKREPERHFGIFALFVSFFPVLLSGPIERSTTLLPQLYREVEYDYDRFTDGLKLMAWGFFQKFVIADRLGLYISQILANPEAYSGLPVLLTIYLFPIQVFCDFSGYTDIAIGMGQTLGYKLTVNFRRPFKALTLSEMWRRWHISLISWFRDYLYIPMGGNRVSRWRYYFNIMTVFTVSGLWHGAAWTFVVWGSMNGVFIVISNITMKAREWLRESFFGGIPRVPASVYFLLAAIAAAGVFLPAAAGWRVGPGAMVGIAAFGFITLVLGLLKTRGDALDRSAVAMKRYLMMFGTFNLFAFSGIFFAARSVKDGWYMITHCAGTNITMINLALDPIQFTIMIALLVLLLVIHHIQETRGSIRELLRARPVWVRWSFYFLLCAGIVILGVRGNQQFIYFRF